MNWKCLFAHNWVTIDSEHIFCNRTILLHRRVCLRCNKIDDEITQFKNEQIKEAEDRELARKIFNRSKK
jgi:hypothetical protein